VIICGWCGGETPHADRCARCRHVDPARPWIQRDEPVPVVVAREGRPALDEDQLRREYADAVRELGDAGQPATVEAIAERLDRSPRTVREWRKRGLVPR
jgi:hypothetical protein